MEFHSGQSILLLKAVDIPSLEADLQAQVGSDGRVVSLEYSKIWDESKPFRLGFGNACFDGAISIGITSSFHSDGVLGEILRVLKPGCPLVLREFLASEDAVEAKHAPRSLRALDSRLVLSGFLSSSSRKDGEGLREVLPAFVDNSQISRGAVMEVVAKKPQWEVGTAVPLAKRNFKSVVPAGSAPARAAPISSGDEELIDEDSLLSAEDMKPVSVAVDCGTSKTSTKKACKNCSCGRASGQAKAKVTLSSLQDAPPSACGNCYLGDAFRCGGCPYQGLPPFKPGEKISLNLTADA
mmetsp:Transcript_23679/g.38955  ORF Transcript_23679/g.38955 Transcript_23679/m.38955 type:complete len:296 (+) Transcript_23679:67-954(+)|eukprot:CAMPEP_0184646872 /NCGR_PEP_ID=MMETSP0308-20130426/3659_1 /TAXON_ID=38269 /ORGANISM="Gloeochaete witrockiana, Strain SAG 46.84" /LENGTH=295 /DNA_ID=CAMNT_0027077305 /DNA_START=66 /DNA_END=953 /DNA_ORIENTATION=-